MINYYYELNDDVKVLDREVKYLSITDVKPDTVGWRYLHEEAYRHSQRVWLENANGIKLVVEDGREVLKEVDPYLITWLKLVCREVEQL